MQVLLQRGGLLIAGMRVKVGGEGREQYGVWREGTHDDLVFAVVLAYWAARKMYPNEPTGEEGSGEAR